MDRYPLEKGGSEWAAFNAVHEDRHDVYPVAAFQRFIMPRLRIRKDRLLFTFRLRGAN